MITRRKFIGTAAMTAATLPRLLSASTAPKTLRIACIGVGNMGMNDIKKLTGEQIVAVCDLDPKAIAKAKEVYPDAKEYTDFRILLEALKDEIDAVTISTPDHLHFPIALLALQYGKHVYVQKPLAHSVEEVRILMAEAQKRGLVTQMGNQGHAFGGIRLIREWAEAGLIGEITEVKAWTNRPKNGWGFIPEQFEYPAAKETPEWLDWDQWTGPVKDAPGYDPDAYHPTKWRGWWKFGMGGLGDIGCHTLDTPFWALDLEIPHKVDVEVDHVNPIFTPSGSIVTFHCRQRNSEKVIPMTWYEGEPRPEISAELGDTELHHEGGLLLIGTKGVIYHPGMRPDSPRLFPEALWQEFRKNPELRPPEVYPRIKGNHVQEWLRAIKGEGPTPGSNFEYAGPLTEMVILGSLAIRTGKGIDYDAQNQVISNNPEANEMLRYDAKVGYRVEDLQV